MDELQVPVESLDVFRAARMVTASVVIPKPKGLHADNVDVNGKAIAMSVPEIIRRLCSLLDSATDPEFSLLVFRTRHLWCSSETFGQLLWATYRDICESTKRAGRKRTPGMSRSSVLLVLKQWVSDYWKVSFDRPAIHVVECFLQYVFNDAANPNEKQIAYSIRVQLQHLHERRPQWPRVSPTRAPEVEVIDVNAHFPLIRHLPHKINQVGRWVLHAVGSQAPLSNAQKRLAQVRLIFCCSASGADFTHHRPV